MDSNDELVMHPSQTDTLIGQDQAEAVFLDAFNENRLHHAWLLTGSKGIGKASFAYRAARFMLAGGGLGVGGSDDGLFGDVMPAESYQTLDVDGGHPIVSRIKAGGHGDLLTVNRTENPKTGKMRADIVIDDVRRVISFFNQTSTEGGWRIAIIDAVDELNVNAANALLKVLEEPPEKALLLLVAHSPGRLLPTIRSRCRQLPLSRLTSAQIIELLSRNAADISGADARILAGLSNGAAGRALELAAVDGLKVYNEVLGLLGGLPRVDIPALHSFADSVSGVKVDARYRIFVSIFRDILDRLVRFAATGKPMIPELDRENAIFARLSGTRRLDQWLDLCEKISETFNRADAVNLDKKQVLLTCFGKLAA